MQTRDELRWKDQELELQADETSRKFLAFFDKWFTNADMIMDQPDWLTGDAMRQALALTEDELGFISMEWIGQMLLLATEHWVHGERLAGSLTLLEERMLAQMAAIKLVELQESADTSATL